jgi:hypothetical protein
MSEDDRTFAEAVCDRLREIEFPPVLPAKIVQGDHVLSIGRASLPTLTARGWFSPDGEIRQDIPDHGINLILSGTPDAIPLKDFHYCDAPTTTYHYHFQIEEKT